MAFMPTRAGRGPSTPIIFVPTLNDLVLSGALVAGVASTGTILNATTGSTISSSIPGLTVNSAARTYSYNGAGSPGSVQGLTETLAGATFSPRNNSVTIVSASIPAFTSNPSISPTSGDQNTTFTAIDGAMSNGGAVSARRWLLNGTSIGTGTTIVTGAPGSLVLENTGTGNVTATSPATTVASAGTPTPTPIQITSAPTGTTPEEQVYARQLKASQAVTFSKGTGGDTAAFNLAQATVPSDTAVLTLPGQDFEAGKTTFVANLVASAPNTPDVAFTHTVTITDVAEAAANTVGAYTASGASSLTYAEATYPPAMYDADTNQTLMTVERFDASASKRRSSMYIQDHAANQTFGPYDAFDQRDTNDDHGCPAICKCNGYLWVFGGTHNEETYWARTTTRNDNKSGFTRMPDIVPSTAGDGYCYWHPVVAGKRIYLFTRMRRNDRHFVVLNVIDTQDDGTATVTAPTTIFDLGNDTRCYMGIPIYEADSVAIPLIRADQADTFRRDVYIFRYRFADGAMTNFGGTFSTTTFPVQKASADTNFRVADQTTAGTYGTIPQLQKGADGTVHLTYGDGAAGNTLGVVDLPLVYRSWDGTAFGAATQVATLKNRYDTHTLVPLANGDLEVYYTSQNAALTFSRDGDVSVVRRTGGVWGSPAKVAASSGAYGLGRIATVKDGTNALRVIFSEGGFAPGNNNSGGSENATVGCLRGFAVGVGAQPFGFTPRPET